MCRHVPSYVLCDAFSRASSSKTSVASSDKTYRAGADGVSTPSCYYMPNPPYTKEAKAAKFQGVVVVEGVITLDGRITNTRVLKSPGMGLDEAVLFTLKKWKCKPATHDGEQVPAVVQFEVNFRLNSKGS